MRKRQRKRFDHGEPIAKIDTRPLAFVALFLAIVFLVPAAQQRVHALVVELPSGQGLGPFASAPPYMTVAIAEDGELTLDGTSVLLQDLSREIIDREISLPIVLVRAEPNTAYEIIALTLSKISEANVLPSNICFAPDELIEHRRFDKITFQPALTIQPEPSELNGEPSHTRLGDIPPSGCEQFELPSSAYLT